MSTLSPQVEHRANAHRPFPIEKKENDLFLLRDIVAPILCLQAAIFIVPEAAFASSDAVWITPVRYVLDPALNLGQFFMLLRVIFSWYPDINVLKMPYLLVTFPTEPILRFTRNIVPPAFGVDVSPVVWIAILSFFREILFGQQGLFEML